MSAAPVWLRRKFGRIGFKVSDVDRAYDNGWFDGYSAAITELKLQGAPKSLCDALENKYWEHREDV